MLKTSGIRKTVAAPIFVSVFALFGIIFLLSSVVFAQTPISCGQTVTGSISTKGQKNDYTFSAAAGDVVSMRVDRTSGGIDPCLELFDSTGALVAIVFAIEPKK